MSDFFNSWWEAYRGLEREVKSERYDAHCICCGSDILEELEVWAYQHKGKETIEFPCMRCHSTIRYRLYWTMVLDEAMAEEPVEDL